mgnify:CR=1 FL=1
MTSAPTAPTIPPLTPEEQAAFDEKEALRRAALQKSFLKWWMFYGVILPKEGTMRGMPIDGRRLEPNVMQLEVQKVVNWFRAKNLPVRIISLKPRTRGSSTIFGALFFHYMSMAPANTTGRIIGGNEEQPRTMLEILSKLAQYDCFFRDTNPAEISTRGLRGEWRNGSQVKANTLGGKSQVIGSMNGIVWGTEGGLWDCPGDDNIMDAAERWANILIATPYTPDTMIFEESTARGASGLFYDRFNEAEPWEEVQKNDKFTKNCARVSLFFPFYIFDTTMEIGPDLDEKQSQEFLETLTDEELSYRKIVLAATGHELTATKMKWRRWAIANLCNDDPTKFDRDYPYSAAEAFTKSGNPRFSRKSTAILRKQAKIAANPELGNLTTPGPDPFTKKDRVQWTRVHDQREAKYWMYEQPIPGCRYWVVCDPCEGKTNPGNKDPDSHGIAAFRQGYRDEHGRWHPMKLVCQAAQYDGKKLGCRWEPSYAEAELWQLSRYYGGTHMVPIVIERPIDCGMNRTLRDKGAPLYVQSKPNTIEEKDEVTYGFLQNKNTKLDCVGQLAARLAENHKAEDGGVLDGGGIEICDLWTIDEMENFVQNADGSCSAGLGHDDQVMKTAMACATERCAVPYYPPVMKLAAFELAEMREMAQAKRKSGGNW